MSTKIRRMHIFLGLVSCLAACQKDSPPPPVNQPGKAALVFPQQNSVCFEGTAVSPAESAVEFRWNRADHTDSYEVTVKNLVTAEVQTAGTAEDRLELVLSRNAPYSWFVTSKSRQTGVTAKSEVFRFYNAGPGVVSYAPFPAEIIFPGMGALVSAGQISLEWEGSDADGDLAAYDVYLGTTANPPLLQAGLLESRLGGIPVQAGTVYYWRVVSRDSRGNTSDSGIYQFTGR